MELAQYTVTGYGGSDLTPAMELLAADPQVRAAAIITDGDVQFPTDPMPYAVLWVLPPGRSARFIRATAASSWTSCEVERRAGVMKVIQELVAHFERQNKLSLRRSGRCSNRVSSPSDAPARIQDLCDTPGTTYYFRVTGATEGGLWGTDVYTGDSVLACGGRARGRRQGRRDGGRPGDGDAAARAVSGFRSQRCYEPRLWPLRHRLSRRPGVAVAANPPGGGWRDWCTSGRMAYA